MNDLIQRRLKKNENRKIFIKGMKDAVPIGLGYFAVAFSLGIVAGKAGLDAIQGFLISFLNNASAGEYAAFTVIAAGGSFLEIALVTLIANARYLLMSCVLSQKFDKDTPFFHRFFVAFDVTDELFAINVMRPGRLNPRYTYGAMLVAMPGWAFGTAFGIIMGNVLPFRIVSALGVALYGMFIAIIIPPAKKDKVITMLVVICFLLSYLATSLPYVRDISSGTRTIILTVVIAGAAAVLFPVDEEEEVEKDGLES